MLACLAESRQRSAQPYAAYLRPNFEVKDNEKLNTYQIFPDYFIKTLLWGLTPAVSFQNLTPEVSLRLTNGTKNKQQPQPSWKRNVAAAMAKPHNGA